MYPFSKVDMAQATRLTREGKLDEAMALLQGRPISRVPQADSAPKSPVSTRLITRLPSTEETGAPQPSVGARAASNPFKRPIAKDVVPNGDLAALPGLADSVRALRNRLTRMRSLPGLAKRARAPSVAVPAGALFEERTFASDAGARNYKVYAPSRFRGEPLPVVVMLHGCTQDPDDFAVGTRMNELAEEMGFLVAYPHQPSSANMKKCWNWFNPGHQRRDGGEPSIIAGIALQVVEEFSADPTRIYVAGLSAGGAAAAILGRTHPDVFAAVGVHSGLACGAARDIPSAFAAMAGNGVLPPRTEGQVAPTIVFHGDADRTVHVVNGDQVIAQAIPEAALSEIVIKGETPDSMAYTRTVHLDTARKEVSEHWVLHGAGHAWSGGDVNGSYADARGPDASREMIRFFLQHTNNRSFASREK